MKFETICFGKQLKEQKQQQQQYYYNLLEHYKDAAKQTPKWLVQVKKIQNVLRNIQAKRIQDMVVR